MLSRMEKGVPVRSLARGIAVLQAVNRHGPLSMMEIARASAVPYPTAFRLVQTLVFQGLIEQSPAGKTYRPTELVQTLASGFEGRASLVRVARPHLVALTRQIEWPVSLMTRVADTMVIRDSTHAYSRLGATKFIPGYSIPILKCAAGLAFVAHMAEEDGASVLAAIRPFPARAPTEVLEAIDAGLLERIRAHGYATRENGDPLTRHPGTTASIAVPVFHDGSVAGALTMAFYSSAMPLAAAIERIAPAFRATAELIAGELAA